MATVAAFTDRHPFVGLDTSVFIYYYEEVQEYLPATQALFERLEAGSFAAVTSVVTLTELITQPLSRRQYGLAGRYTSALRRFPNLELVDISVDMAYRAGQMRARYRLRTMDALQVSSVLEAGATGFITNDRRLQRIQDLDVLILADTDEVRGIV